MANLTNEQIKDSDALANLLYKVGSLSAREIYAVIGRQSARVLGFAVQSGRVVKNGENFELSQEARRAIRLAICEQDWVPSSYADR